MGFLSPIFRWQVFQDGKPAAGAKLFSYLSGGTTPSPLYNHADINPLHAHTNPVIADSTGTFPVLYLDNLNYRYLVTDALGVTIFPAQDNIRNPEDFGPIMQTYTPTLFNAANIALTTAFTCQYMRVGNVVTVSGGLNITPTAINTLSAVGISLPITSAFTDIFQCGGTASPPKAFGYVGAFIAFSTVDTGPVALLQFTTTDTITTVDQSAWSFIFQYLIV